jgi:hypothetical protein
MKARVNFIRELLVRTYEGSPWHSFKTAVRGLTEEEALWVPPTGYKGYRWADGSILKIIFHLGADKLGTELEFVIMVIAVSCVKLLSAHNSTQHTSRKHKV